MNTLLHHTQSNFEALSTAYRALEQQNRDMIDGLYYASSVQQGLMPRDRHFKTLNNPYFVYYRPQQIIGGDFFWLGKKEDWVYYAVGDCTGHGVSGAMLSSLAIGFLNYLLYSKDYEKIGDLLNELDKKWMETFRSLEDDFNNDWLEIALVAYNRKARQLQFASAKRKAYIVKSQNHFIELNGTEYPIGGWQIEAERKFITQQYHLDYPFKMYLLTDGFQDQLGGPKGKRFGRKKLEEHIREMAYLSIEAQQELTNKRFLEWMDGRDQTDDVCLLGLEFN